MLLIAQETGSFSEAMGGRLRAALGHCFPPTLTMPERVVPINPAVCALQPLLTHSFPRFASLGRVAGQETRSLWQRMGGKWAVAGRVFLRTPITLTQ